MAGVNLNEIYQAIGSLTSAVEGLGEQIKSNERRNAESIAKVDESLKDAAKSRADVHKRLDALETGLHSVKEKTTEMQAVTDDVKVMRSQAQGAGKLGRWALKIAGWVISAAAGFASAYYALTGRPPP